MVEIIYQMKEYNNYSFSYYNEDGSLETFQRRNDNVCNSWELK